SHSPHDASLQQAKDSLDDDNIASLSFAGIQSTGLHRTTTEIANRRAIKETNLGAAGRWRLSPGKLSIGFTSLLSRFSHEQEPPPRLYNQFAFRGRQNWTASLFAEGHWQQLTYFSEWALSKGGGWGGISGLIVPLSHGLDMSLLFRHYTKDFYSFYGAAFGEGTRLQNETGFYWGLKYRYKQALWFTAYFDYFLFPWLRYRVSAPSGGYEYMLRANWQPNKQLMLYAQYRGEHKDRDVNSTEKTKMVAEGIKHNYILNLDFKPDKAWQLRSRVQGSRFQQTDQHTRGYAVMQDVSYTFRHLRLSGRYALFQTDDWDNRQYAFERDVLWAFSIPAYYGRGIRYYALLQWKARHNLSLWLRWARTHFRDREEIGSGMEKIVGNTRSNLKIQLKIDF
ncbi:MAG: helix-hairpin-helix domain-containing protein, partial [Bacteroidetes bacterium]|nr:helix-hairpin-helix domain-containing protein [Bacteroidota bacterium]